MHAFLEQRQTELVTNKLTVNYKSPVLSAIQALRK